MVAEWLSLCQIQVDTQLKLLSLNPYRGKELIAKISNDFRPQIRTHSRATQQGDTLLFPQSQYRKQFQKRADNNKQKIYIQKLEFLEEKVLNLVTTLELFELSYTIVTCVSDRMWISDKTFQDYLDPDLQ